MAHSHIIPLRLSEHIV